MGHRWVALKPQSGSPSIGSFNFNLRYNGKTDAKCESSPQRVIRVHRGTQILVPAGVADPLVAGVKRFISGPVDAVTRLIP